MAHSIKRGAEVVVIAGAHKGQRGKVLEMLTRKDRVVVEGVNLVKKHERKTQENPEGAIVEREGSLHISNVMLAERFDARQNKKAG
ncbi:MAG: 50S ribosomal protein L24 [Opitutales bacterium]